MNKKATIKQQLLLRLSKTQSKKEQLNKKTKRILSFKGKKRKMKRKKDAVD
jgi:hypothetical protein